MIALDANELHEKQSESLGASDNDDIKATTSGDGKVSLVLLLVVCCFAIGIQSGVKRSDSNDEDFYPFEEVSSNLIASLFN